MTENPTLVQKFGGTSVSTADRRAQVIEHVRRARDEGYQVAIVVSAMGRRGDPYATDTLLDLLRGDGDPVDGRDYDMIFTCGEIISATLMSHLLKREGVPSVGLTGAQALIHTDDNHTEAEIVDIDPARVQFHLDRGEVPVVAGCQGVIREINDYTTLGRGGSDTSAVALGGALDASKVEIYTDVEGVANVDPRIVQESHILKRISYDKMYEMARYGARVVHQRAVRAGQEGGVPVVVRSTFSTAPGTTIANAEDESPIVGIPALGPLDVAIFEEDVVAPETRGFWERRRGIMSLIDSQTGTLVLGVSADKSYELESAIAEAGLSPKATAGDQCWVSPIGGSEALQARRSRDPGLLRQQGIEVLYHESADQRSTYVVHAGNEAEAVRVLYRDVFGNT
ncbi:MAG: Aspartate kinase [Anaerolineales bacterium]|nr:Aspartate kinase [Anaerolineales bacterium]